MKICLMRNFRGPEKFLPPPSSFLTQGSGKARVLSEADCFGQAKLLNFNFEHQRQCRVALVHLLVRRHLRLGSRSSTSEPRRVASTHFGTFLRLPHNRGRKSA